MAVLTFSFHLSLKNVLAHQLVVVDLNQIYHRRLTNEWAFISEMK